jgi:aspartate aminotransferase
MNPLSHRIQRIKPSPTLAVTARAMELKAQGIDLISLTVGEPDFDTPDHIKAAAIDAIKAGKTKYTAVEGTPELKKAICAKLERDNHLSYQPKQILVSCGAKHSIFNLLQAVINEGDEVLIPAPYWVSYPDMALVCDGTPVFLSADIAQGFKITPEQLEKSIAKKTKLLIINSPSNPTGVAYTKAELQALAAVLLRHPQVLICSDDIYEHILWNKDGFHNLASVCPELYERTIVVNGVSKAYAMTGWRIGYAAGPVSIIQAMSTLQSQNTSNACSISQAAAVAGLNGDQACLIPMVKAFKERHDYLVPALNALEGFNCVPGDGAFYVFANIEKAMQTLGLKSDVQFSEFLLDKARVAVVPGSAFGADGYIRLSYATSLENLKKAVERIKACLAK